MESIEQLTSSVHYKPGSKGEWLTLFNEWEQSGKTQAEFCRDKNIRYKTFIARRSNLLGKANKNNATLTPVRVIGAAAPLAHSGNIEVRLPLGVMLSIPPRMDDATIRMVIDAVKGIQ